MDEHKQTCSIGSETPRKKSLQNAHKHTGMRVGVGILIHRDQWGHMRAHSHTHFPIRTIAVSLKKYLNVLRVLAVGDKLCCEAPLVLL